MNASKARYGTLGPIGQMSIHGSTGVKTFVLAETNMVADRISLPIGALECL